MKERDLLLIDQRNIPNEKFLSKNDALPYGICSSLEAVPDQNSKPGILSRSPRNPLARNSATPQKASYPAAI
jgi:hypothetical protein